LRTQKNILFHTFVGLDAEIINSATPDLIGLKGEIIDETKNMLIFRVRDENGGESVKKIQKKPNIFKFYLEDKTTIDILGKGILFRYFERAKKVKRRTAVLK